LDFIVGKAHFVKTYSISLSLSLSLFLFEVDDDNRYLGKIENTLPMAFQAFVPLHIKDCVVIIIIT